MLLVSTFSCEKPFTEYSLGVGIAPWGPWKNLNYDNTVIIINNNSELEHYFAGTGDDFPNINFSKRTLLIANGVTGAGINTKSIKGLQRFSINRYKLNIEISVYDTADLGAWVTTLTTNKLRNDAYVELNVKIKK